MAKPGRGAVFFDRDGVLNVDTDFLIEPADVRWEDGAIEAVALANRRGLAAIVVTNQSGVARGFFSCGQVEALHRWMNGEMAAHGAFIDAFYYCPFHPDAVIPGYRHPDHPERKPNPGMLLRAIADFGLDPAASVIIGDRPRDIEAGRRAGVAGLLHTGGSVAGRLGRWLAAQERGPEDGRSG